MTLPKKPKRKEIHESNFNGEFDVPCTCQECHTNRQINDVIDIFEGRENNTIYALKVIINHIDVKGCNADILAKDFLSQLQKKQLDIFYIPNYKKEINNVSNL